MCGIAGIYRKNGIQERDKLLLECMGDSMKHRGPDDFGYYYSDSFGIAHRRLSIIDISEKGKQPLSYAGRYKIVYNGEIYNYIELREELLGEGYCFDSDSDTEVLVSAYDFYGIDFLNKINGMWAFILYDRETNQLIVSRDRFGVKPLYYYKKPGYFLFASEIKAILCDDNIERYANDIIIYDYLQKGLVDHTDETFFSEVKRFPAGNYLVINLSNADGWDFRKYYDISFNKELFNEDSFNQASKMLRKLFDDSIEKRLRADVNLGTCLSGGLDSSALVTHVNKIKNGNNVQHTFSFCPSDENISEIRYIREVVKGKDVESHIVSDDVTSISGEINRLIKVQDEPFGSLSIYASLLVYSSASQEGIKVLLDGQGADEILCGYRKSKIFYIKELVKEKKIRKAIIEILCETPELFRYNLSGDDIRKIKEIVSKGRRTTRREVCLNQGFADKFKSTSVYNTENFQDLDFFKISLPQLLRYSDRNSMACSVESRLPFLDYRLVELCAKMPLSFKINKGVSKHIMRQSLDMPDMVRKRKDKVGFGVPEVKWIKEDEEYFKELFEREGFKSGKYIKCEYVRENWDEFISQKNIRFLFRMICLELWMRQYGVVSKNE